MRYLVLVAFFGSGLSSLILENLWVRMLTLVFGGTTLAITTVLTVFMGGLALGSHLAGRYVRTIQHPLRWYAYLEASIALYATLLPWMIAYLPTVYRLVPESWPFLTTALLRFGLCVLLLLFPTTLMGATLPILSQHFVRNPSTIGEDAGLLYSVNTFGAVAGALLGGFVLLPLLGNNTTLWTVTSGLFALALCVLGYDLWFHRQPSTVSTTTTDHASSSEYINSLTSSSPQTNSPPVAQESTAPTDLPPLLSEQEAQLFPWREESETSSQDTGKSAEEDTSVSWGMASRDALYAGLTIQNSARFQRIIVAILALTGASAMLCQIVWSRTLAMIIGSSTYAFTLILGLFLIGLASGAVYGARLTRRSLDLLRSWVNTILWTAFFVGLGSFCFDALPGLFIRIALELPENVSAFTLFLIKTLIAAIPVLIPTFLMGTFFPIALALYAPPQQPVGQSVGQLYTFNTIGAIVGSAATGFFIIPWIGLQHGLALAVLGYLLCAVLLMSTAQHHQRHLYGTMAVVGCLVVFFLPTWNHGLMSLGTFRLSNFQNHSFQEATAYSPILFYKEGISATVSVEGTDKSRTLKINGKPEASTAGDRPTQISIAAVPLALHPNPKDVALIGWGSGMTAGAALHFPLRQLVAVELEPVVIEAARLMEPWNFRPHRHKQLNIVYNDGRNYLATTSQQFDVIISEPSNPWISGVANLFTREYFQLVRQKLRPQGIFCQWVQLYEISSRNVTSIFRSIQQEFPYVRVFEVNRHDTDTFVIATKHPWKLNPRSLQAVIQSPRYRDLFRQAMITHAYDILPRFLMGEKELPQLFKKIPTPANTDDYNRLEFTAPLDLVQASATGSDEPFQQTVEALNNPWPAYLDTTAVISADTTAVTSASRADFWIGVSDAYLRYGNVTMVRTFLAKATQVDPKHPRIPLIHRTLRLLDYTDTEPSLPDRGDVQRTLERHGKKVRKLLRQFLESHTLFEKKKYDRCLSRFRRLSQQAWFSDLFPQVHYYHGMCAHHKNQHVEAAEAITRYLDKSGVINQPSSPR